jgi:hypothetical protein
MPNLNYSRSRQRELEVVKSFQKKGWFAVRSAGSHGIADVVAIRPHPDKCPDPNHFEVKFIQIKVSQNTAKYRMILKVENSPCGLLNVEWHKYPVKSKSWHKKRKKVKENKKRRTTSYKSRLKKMKRVLTSEVINN